MFAEAAWAACDSLAFTIVKTTGSARGVTAKFGNPEKNKRGALSGAPSDYERNDYATLMVSSKKIASNRCFSAWSCNNTMGTTLSDCLQW